MGLRNRNGIWYWRLWVKGQEYSGSTGLAATRPNVSGAKRRMAAELEKLRQRGQKPQEIAFCDAAAQFTNWCQDVEYRGKPNTARRIKTSMASLVAFLGEKPVADITPGDVEQYKEWRIRAHGIKDVTLRHDLHNLSLFFRKWAKKHRLVFENPVDEVSKPSDVDAVRIHVLTDDEEERYFAEAANRQTLYDVARLILLQGCRPEEIMALQQNDVDLEREQINIRGGKTAAARRTLDLIGESFEILARRLDGGKYVFPSPRYPGRHITKLNGQHDTVCREAGVSFVLYDLRHTFASRLANDGVPVPTIAALLGHSGLRAVMKYIHVSSEAKKEAMRRYEAALRPRLKVVG